ncbi:MAG: TSUP family transporter [Deltaproteobacteria bacterium]|nr:TSUP family transporter [Deltaproteobacteria bacterium]
MESIAIHTYLFLGFAGFFAGFVDSIAGGGGLISLPVLISAGFPPHLALGTNKLQGSFGTFTATLNYSRKHLVSFRETFQGIIFTAIGAGIGTVTIQHLSADFLNNIIPVLLLTVFLYILFFPQLGTKDSKAFLSHNTFYIIFGLTLGFYDGFFGPGAGSFWMMVFVIFMGINLKKATAHTKIMNFTSNIIALIFFIIGNNVMYTAGIIMGIGQMLGAYTGSNLVVLKGVKFIRVFFLAVIALTIIKMAVSVYL